MKKKLIDAALVAQAKKVLSRTSALDLMAKLPMARAAGRPDKSWYRIAKTADEATITIYDEIGMWGCSANEFVSELAEIDAKIINVRLNSPGGSVFDGIAIYNAIAEKDAKIIMYVDGWAASIASVIMCAGDEIKISEAAQVMVHKPWSFVIGNDEDMVKEAGILQSLETAIIDIYVARTGGDREEITAWVKAETWFRGKSAVEAGFCDEVVPLKIVKPGKTEDAAAPSARMPREFFSSIFLNVPEEVLDALAKVEPVKPADEIKTARDFRAFLCEFGGFGGTLARKIAMNGFKPTTEPRTEDVVAERTDLVADPLVEDAPVVDTPAKPDPRIEDVNRAAAASAVWLAAKTFPKS